jgi:SAM-dependent methyltransferase
MTLGYMRDPKRRHRKAWEWVHGMYGLKLLGVLNEKTSALGVGAGKEPVLYYLANHVNRVLATDVYGTGSWEEAPKEMLDKPESFAPFPYREDHLSVQHMDGRSLILGDASFDVVFSFSSIEHFGGHAAATRAIREMARVVRPGGVVVVVTELILNGLPHSNYFLPHQIKRELIEPSGLKLVEDIDFSLSEETSASKVVNLDDSAWQSISPHYIVRQGDWVWTSILFFLERS